jgi:hypothetical protein
MLRKQKPNCYFNGLLSVDGVGREHSFPAIHEKPRLIREKSRCNV